MTQEDKELLLKDLSARLPYGVICKCTYPVNNETTYGENVLFTNNYEIEGISRVGASFAGERRWYKITFDGETHDIDDDGIKVVPYLRPMSSMTDAEGEEYRHLLQSIWDKLKDWKCANLIDWLNAHHFDYRGLIEKGLAIEAPKGMYKTK